MNLTLPDNHAALRSPDYHPPGCRMIGRLTADEFDLLDAISTNLRAGVTPRAEPLAKTLCVLADSLKRRLYNAASIGLVDAVLVDEISVDGVGRPMAVNVYSLTACGELLFGEALELMDRGLVAA